MPSKNMLPKGKRRQSVKAAYREARTLAEEKAAAERARAAAAFEDLEPVADDGATYDTADMMDYEPTLEQRIATNDWITTRGASGSKVAEETHSDKRYGNPYEHVHDAPQPAITVLEDLDDEGGVRSFTAETAAAGMRLDAFLAKAVPEVSRARVQTLIEQQAVHVDGRPAKASLRMKGGELVEIEGAPQREPMAAVPEDIPLTVVYEDDAMAVIDKPAGMMVHAGSGSGEHNRGTLVNALLHHFGSLSGVGGELRPGIVHRLDKMTSGLIVVAKDDVAHRKLAAAFAERKLRKQYIALVHGHVQEDEGTVQLPISRDLMRRTRMTTRRAGGRTAVSHWRVLERITGPYGKFTLLEVRIETGRTHQIRVHMQAIGHPVVGDTLYGAPEVIQPAKHSGASPVTLSRNFLHAAELDLPHPRTAKLLELRAPLPEELEQFLTKLTD